MISTESIALVMAVPPVKVIVGGETFRVVYSLVLAVVIVGAIPVKVVAVTAEVVFLVSKLIKLLVPSQILKAPALFTGILKYDGLTAVKFRAPADIIAKVPKVEVETVRFPEVLVHEVTPPEAIVTVPELLPIAVDEVPVVLKFKVPVNVAPPVTDNPSLAVSGDRMPADRLQYCGGLVLISAPFQKSTPPTEYIRLVVVNGAAVS